MSLRGKARPAIATLAVGALLGLAACTPPAPPPGPGACQGPFFSLDASATPAPAIDLGTVLTPGGAGELARQLVGAVAGLVQDLRIPLVTTELVGGRPRITTTAVASPDEAAAVADERAADGDLVGVEVAQRYEVATNDPYFAQQWAFTRLDFPTAWNTHFGQGVRVAVIDSGVQADHPDLAGHVAPGYQFLSSNDGQFTYYGSGGTTDPVGHGTHVAGIVAASTGNGIGIAGAAPGAEILPVTALCGDGGGWDSDIANAVIWAVDNGARVINMSMSGPDSLAVAFAIQYARDRDVVVVAAAGNSGPGTATEFPAAYPTVIAVGATDSANSVAGFSTRGPQVDLAAPGVDVLSTWTGSSYVYDTGTSMAAPHVAAAAALVRGAHPDYGAASVCLQLVRTALDIGPPGDDDASGWGLVRPDRAVGPTQATGPACS
jgi:subtilisin family serine protease